jgi:hypothetical protein
MPKPDFIIIGAMKCATTTLHEQLAQQPGFIMSEPKEPNFFSDDDQYARGMNYYHSLFDAAGDADLCGESSTHYTKLPTYPHTIERLKKHVPEAKFIYVMRHPIDRLISQYIHEWSQRTVTGDINHAVKSFAPLIQYSQYSMQIRPYLESFGAERVLPVFSENLRRHPQRELERVCRFIGYSEQPTWVDDLSQQHKSAERLRDSAWRDVIVHQPMLASLRRTFVPKDIRTWVRGFWQMKERPNLSNKDCREYLTNLFDEDLAVLGAWLNIELSCKNFKEAVDSGPEGFVNWQEVATVH